MEGLIWGFGDGSTLPVSETVIGRPGAVIYWENIGHYARPDVLRPRVDECPKPPVAFEASRATDRHVR